MATELEPEALARWCQRTLPEDTRAFEYLVAQYKQRVFATSYRVVGNYQEAEDIAQEVFLKIFHGIRRLENPATLTNWIYRITYNACFEALARQKRRPTMMPFAPPDAEGREEPQYADSSTPTPEEAALQQELRHCIELALASLDTTSRASLVLREIEERSYQEIADTMSIGLSAVKMRIHRARLAFQQMLVRVCPDAWRAERQTV